MVISVVQNSFTYLHNDAYDKQYCTIVLIMRWVVQNSIAIIASTFLHGYKCCAKISTMIAYDKQYCTIVLIMRWVVQNSIAIIASTFLSNIAQLCLSKDEITLK